MITVRELTEKDKKIVNQFATHPLQSYEWGEFRKATGITVIRKGLFDKGKCIGAFQMTIHKIPHTKYTIGYIPKGTLPTREMIDALRETTKAYNCIFVQFEPNIFASSEAKKQMKELGLISSAHPLFTKYTFQLDMTKSEEELLKNMHQKTRYNIKVAQKHGVEVKEENSEEAFAIYWQLTEETTKRQNFYAHTKKYHELMWQTLHNTKNDGLSAHLFLAWYKPEDKTKKIPLAAWVLFTFHNMLYYPYGSSSSEYRNVMASNLMMWEAILYGKKKGLKTFDMWGSMGPEPDTNDPWYGFHRLKMGYSPKLVEFVGSYDLVINKPLYVLYVVADKLRWMMLKIRR